MESYLVVTLLRSCDRYYGAALVVTQMVTIYRSSATCTHARAYASAESVPADSRVATRSVTHVYHPAVEVTHAVIIRTPDKTDARYPRVVNATRKTVYPR